MTDPVERARRTAVRATFERLSHEPERIAMQSQSRLVYTIPQAAEATQTGKTKLYAEIKAGRLPIVKVGRKTLIRHETLDKWLRESETRHGDHQRVSDRSL